jgi:adenylate kinase
MKKEDHNRFSAILMFGPPGSGKGTQGKFLGLVGSHYHLSSGDIFRGLSPQSPSGKLFYEYARHGKLVPDDATIEICRRYILGLIATNRYFPEKQLLILDGLPRTKRQAEILEDVIEVKKIILLDVPDRKVLIDRLEKRAAIEQRNDDQKRAVLEQRIRAYEQQTLAVLSHYPKSLIATFNAIQTPAQVLCDILHQLCPLLDAWD